MITMQTKVVAHPEVLATPLSNQEMVLLHLQTQQYYTLNETGARIWQELAQEQSLLEIGQTLETYYAITLDEANHHVQELVSALVNEKLVKLAENV